MSKDVEKSFNEKQDLIETYKIEGKSKINESVLKKYKTYLDWITLVYLADKEKAKDKTSDSTTDAKSENDTTEKSE